MVFQKNSTIYTRINVMGFSSYLTHLIVKYFK